MEKKRGRLLMALVFLAGQACSPLYVREARIAREIERTNYDKAVQLVEKDNFYQHQRNEILYHLELGRLEYLAGRHSKSNQHFTRADDLMDNYRKDYSLEALSMFVNDNVKPYRSEDFENVIVHYFKSVNYLELGQMEDALVEIRRINIHLQELNDQYKERLNHYSDDVFAEIFEGLMYEKAGDINNAFISYRNAAELFVDDGVQRDYFGVRMPEQLKEDVLRTAYLMGFHDEVDRFERLFGMTYTPAERPAGGELVLLWENGLGPVKDQFALNFSIIKGRKKDHLVFVNKQLGISVPVHHANSEERRKMLDLQIIRLVLPKYLGRPHLFSDGIVTTGSKTYPFELTINYNTIAKQCLRDRFLREATRALVRLALKELEESMVRKENNTAGLILGIVNAATEQADTRSWQSIPSDIHYARIPLESGVNKVKVKVFGHGGVAQEQALTVDGKGGLVIERIITPATTDGRLDYGFVQAYD